MRACARTHMLSNRSTVFFIIRLRIMLCLALVSVCVVQAYIILRVDLLIFADGFFFNNGPSGSIIKGPGFRLNGCILGAH